VAEPRGKLRREAFFCTDLQATPEQILPWVVMRWSVEITFEERRRHLGRETQRHWSDRAVVVPNRTVQHPVCQPHIPGDPFQEGVEPGTHVP
jgi:hypothetical protein